MTSKPFFRTINNDEYLDDPSIDQEDAEMVNQIMSNHDFDVQN